MKRETGLVGSFLDMGHRLEAGNSPRMVFSNYWELVRSADPEKWFAVTPEAVEKHKAEREKQKLGTTAAGVAMPENVALPGVKAA